MDALKVELPFLPTKFSKSPPAKDTSLSEASDLNLLGIFNKLNYLGDTSLISGEIVAALSKTLFAKVGETK